MARKAYVCIGLPEGFTQVEFIQSSGSQYIDTGFYPSNNARLVLDFENNTHGSGWRGIYGAREGTNNARSFSLFMSSADRFYSNTGNTVYTWGATPSIFGRHMVDHVGNTVTIDGVSHSHSNITFTNTISTLVLFGTKDNGSVGNLSDIKIFSCKIYDNGNLVRDFIPCKNAEGVAGLYDTVDDKFYGNAGSGVFAVGQDVEMSATPRNALEIYAIMDNVLPDGYKLVEFIQSSGTQYIDTGVQLVSGLSAVIDYQATSTASDDYFFSVLKTDTAEGWRAGIYLNAFYLVDFTASQSSDLTARTIFTGTSAKATALNIFLFAENRNGAMYGNASGKMYSCRIYDVSGVLIRYYVPCKNESGAVGLYDLANGEFYENKGTGAFTAGPEASGFVARVQKGYVSIGGVARPFWGDYEVAYYGKIEGLSFARYDIAAASNEEYVVFAGGMVSGANALGLPFVDAYSKNLVKHSVPDMPYRAMAMASVRHGGFALFGGGVGNMDREGCFVMAYDRELSAINPVGLRKYVSGMAAACADDYAIFGGGYDAGYNEEPMLYTDAYDLSLTRVEAPSFTTVRSGLGGASVPGYALFGGGFKHSYENMYKLVRAYDNNLTTFLVEELSVAQRAKGVSFDEKAVFIIPGSMIDVYDKSLTKVQSIPLDSTQITFGCGVSDFVDYAIAAGSTGEDISDNVWTIDKSLTLSMVDPIGGGCCFPAVGSVGSYALIAGGAEAYKTMKAVADVYAYKLI
jgi:hypothetical protein